jgi:hypothetical protein
MLFFVLLGNFILFYFIIFSRDGRKVGKGVGEVRKIGFIHFVFLFFVFIYVCDELSEKKNYYLVFIFLCLHRKNTETTQNRIKIYFECFLKSHLSPCIKKKKETPMPFISFPPSDQTHSKKKEKKNVSLLFFIFFLLHHSGFPRQHHLVFFPSLSS